MTHTGGATTVSQHVLSALREHGQPITINGLLKLIHARYYEDEIIYRGIILTLINLGEIGIDGETMMLTLGKPIQPVFFCTCGHDRESHSEEMPYDCQDDCDCRNFEYVRKTL